MKRFLQRIGNPLSVLFISLVTFWAYRDVLGYFFTGMDTIPLIHSSRIFSLADLKDILLEPGLKAFPGAVNIHKWYRPVSVLSYSVDYALWGLNPSGYHLTDLLLHILVSVSVYYLAWMLSNKRVITALLSSLLFALHPLFMELVPSNARRMDSLAALFTIISFLLFIKHFSAHKARAKLLIISSVSYMIAIGSKEIAVILPCIVIVYSLFYLPASYSIGEKMLKAARYALPYIIISASYLSLRVDVLGGIGGYAARAEGVTSSLRMLYRIELNYIAALVYPVDFLKLASEFDHILARYENMPAPFIIINVILLCSVVVAVKWLVQRVKINNYFMDHDEGKAAGVMIIWFILPLIIYLLTFIHGRYYLYIAGIPFSIIFAFILHGTYRQFERVRNSYAFIRLVLVGMYLIYFFVTGPLTGTYDIWKTGSDISKTFFGRLREYQSYIPHNAAVNVYNFPDNILINPNEISCVREVELPADYSIKAWFDLIRPDNNVVVLVHSTLALDSDSAGIELMITGSQKNVIDVSVSAIKEQDGGEEKNI